METTDVMLRAWWDPGWYALDQPLMVDRHDTFAFYRRDPSARPGNDLVFANNVGCDWDYRSATVVSIEHARFGSLDEVDTRRFGQYTFRFRDGRWVSIEAEESLGDVEAASPDFPVDVCERAWAENSGWAVTVALTDISKARPDRAESDTADHRPWVGGE